MIQVLSNPTRSVHCIPQGKQVTLRQQGHGKVERDLPSSAPGETPGSKQAAYLQCLLWMRWQPLK